MRTIREVLDQLPGSSVETGLPAGALEQSQSLFGANSLTPLPREPLWKRFLEKFDEPIIKILLAAALLSMLVDLFEPPAEAFRYILGLCGLLGTILGGAFVTLRGRGDLLPALLFLAALAIWPVGAAFGHASYEGLAIMIAVVLATGVAFLSEYQSDREFEALNAQKDSIEVKVVRGGVFHTVPLEAIVAGDLVSLEMGDEVPADGRLVKSTDLHVDQSLMTGESEPVHKKARPEDPAHGPEEPGCMYRGTQIVDGVGRMIVTNVGDSTALGQIAQRLASNTDAIASGEAGRIQSKLSISKQLTPLQEKLANLAGLISKIGYGAAVAIFLALLVRGIWVVKPAEVHWPTTGEQAVQVGSVLLHYFMYMVIIIVVAVPEGLPMSVTVSLALAMRKMTRANSLVRQLVACETVGSTTVICSDKTGTLTQNKMTIVRLVYGGELHNREAGDEPKPASGLNAPGQVWTCLDVIALNAAVNSTANLEEKDGVLVPVGSSTEGALLFWLRACGLSYADIRAQFAPLYQVHFSSERKRMTSVIRKDDKAIVLVKGAPEWLLERSAARMAADGSIHAWTDADRLEVSRQLKAASSQAMRTLAFGQAVLPPDLPLDEDSLHANRDRLEEGMVFVGFVAIRDPLREDVKAAVDQCRRAGIDVKMVTGDNIETAKAIGGEIGLLDRPDEQVLSSREFNALSDEQLKLALPRLRILARAQPLDKFRMVKLLQELGHVVAVTGDGTNDAPALKRADVGLAMGKAGTEVAKEASRIVLLDDSFATIVKAVHWGRSLYENIQRFLQFQLTINASALTIAFLGPFVGVKPPFTILQLLWINVIMDTLASIALCSEPPRPGLMDMPPKRRDESILTAAMMRNIVSTAAFFVVVMMGLLLGMENAAWFRGDGPTSHAFPELSTRQVSVFFTVYVLFQVWNEINCRSLVPEVSGLTGLARNRVFLSIVAVIVLGQALIVTFGGEVFQVEPLGWLDWLAMGAATSSVLAFREVARRLGA